MGKDKSERPTPESRIERLDSETMGPRLRQIARELFPDSTMDDLEFEHLIRVISECSVLLNDVYSDDRIRRIMRPGRNLIRSLVDRLIEEQLRDQRQSRVARLPDDVRLVGDKALFDLGLLGRIRVKGYDLAELGAKAYERAGERLQLLAEDRRLQKFFKQNKLLMLPLEEEVVFLRQCSERFRQYADILRHTRDDGSAVSIEDLVDRVPLMAAAAEALEADEDTEAPPVELDGRDVEETEAERVESYAEAARGEATAMASSKAMLLSRFERILLFSGLDLDSMKGGLKSTVVDQQPAIETLCDELSLFAAGTRDPRKPPAYFLVGPTGVGKNHLVESLRRLLEGTWDIEIPMLTIEGPAYTYPSDINELRGATRGFIRSDEEGLLTSFHERSSQSPIGIVLVDEVEKAHPHLLTFFLSILDRGTTTDNRGSELNFANCLMFFTSNLGYSEAQQGAAPIGYLDEEAKQAVSDQDIRRVVRGKLKPEFINRVKMVHFQRLTKHSAERILDLELGRITSRYREIHGLRIELSPEARAELILRGFSPVYGARHLATVLESICNVEIAKRLRRDDRRPVEDRKGVLGWLREMRSGKRPFRAEEVHRRIGELARADVDYEGLRIVFRDGEFDYEPLDGE